MTHSPLTRPSTMRLLLALLCVLALTVACSQETDTSSSKETSTPSAEGDRATPQNRDSEADSGEADNNGASNHAAMPQLNVDATSPARLVDDQDRTVILRGVNINSLGDYHQGNTEFEPVLPLTDADWESMASLGFNTIRLLLSWSRLEPTRGTLDTAYVEQINDTVEVAAQHGMYSILDMHQDAWAKSSATPAGETCPPGLEPAIGWDGAPDWATITGGATTCRESGSQRESSAAVIAAWDNFYANTDSIMDALAETWGRLAAEFAQDHAIAGYDLLNEPNHGSTDEATVAGMSAFYGKAIAAIRAGEQQAGGFSHPAFFETTIRGVPPTAGFTTDTNLVFAGHNYGDSISPIPLEATFAYFDSIAKSFNAPLFIGEYGWFEDTPEAGEKLGRFAATEDKLLTSGATWWQWRQACGDPHSVGKPGGVPTNQVHLQSNACPGDVSGGVLPRWVCLWRPYPQHAPGRLVTLTSACEGGSLHVEGEAATPAGAVLWVPGGPRPEPKISGTNLGTAEFEYNKGGWTVTVPVAAPGPYVIDVSITK